MEKPKILIVDDDGFVRQIYVSMFDQEGFIVEDATDGKNAIDIMRQKNFLPDVIFTGIKMPPMGGFEMIEELKKDEQRKDIPVVISSHRGDENDKKRAQEMGVKDFLISYIITPKEAVKRIREIIGMERVYRLEVKMVMGAHDADRFVKDYPLLFSSMQNASAILRPDHENGRNAFRVVFIDQPRT